MIHDSDDPRLHRYLVPVQSERVAGTIQVFLVSADHRGDIPWELDWSEKFCTAQRVAVVDGELLVGERLCLAQEGSRDSKLAHIVQVGADSDSRLLRLVIPQGSRHQHGLRRDPFHVLESREVHRPDEVAPVGDGNGIDAGSHLGVSHAGLEPAEPAGGPDEKVERFVDAAGTCMEVRELSQRFGLAQRGPTGGGKLDRQPKSGLCQCEFSRLTTDHAQHSVGV